MDATTETRPSGNTPGFLAGLQAGMVGVLWMLAWLGISATWQRRSFWTAENLFASAFYGDESIRSGFAFSTVAGLALYLILYSLVGAIFAAILRDRASQLRTLLLGIVVGVAWYYASFHGFWKSVSPLVPLLHSERPTVIGHLIYGTILGRYPEYWRVRQRPTPAVPETSEPAPEATAEQTPADHTS